MEEKKIYFDNLDTEPSNSVEPKKWPDIKDVINPERKEHRVEFAKEIHDLLMIEDFSTLIPNWSPEKAESYIKGVRKAQEIIREVYPYEFKEVSL